MKHLTKPRTKELLQHNIERYFYKISDIKLFSLNYKTSRKLLEELIEYVYVNPNISQNLIHNNNNSQEKLLKNILNYDNIIYDNTKKILLNTNISEDSIKIILKYSECNLTFCNNLSVINYNQHYVSDNYDHYFCINCYYEYRKLIKKSFAFN